MKRRGTEGTSEEDWSRVNEDKKRVEIRKEGAIKNITADVLLALSQNAHE